MLQSEIEAEHRKTFGFLQIGLISLTFQKRNIFSKRSRRNQASALRHSRHLRCVRLVFTVEARMESAHTNTIFPAHSPSHNRSSHLLTRLSTALSAFLVHWLVPSISQEHLKAPSPLDKACLAQRKRKKNREGLGKGLMSVVCV